MKSKTATQYKYLFLGMFGTLCEYYNLSIFGFLAPILAGVFFPNQSETSALISYFMSYGISLTFVPIGAWIFGHIGDKHGRKAALSISITGMSLVTGLIAIIPTHASLGLMPAAIFIFAIAMQRFFASGEYNGGAIFCLEHTSDKNKHGFVSGLYCASTVTGIILAAFVATLVSYSSSPNAWRYAFLIGTITCFMGFLIRRNTDETEEFTASIASTEPAEVSIKQALCLIGASGFFCVLYSFPVQVMNALIPMITTIKLSTVLSVNTVTLCVYAAALIVTGHYADKFGKKNMMILACSLVALLAYPLFKLVEYNSLTSIVAMKLAYLILTAIFISPFHAWAMDLFPVVKRYKGISLCYALGKIVSCSMPALAIWLWHVSSSLTSISLLMSLWAVIGIVCIKYSRGQNA